MGKYQRLTELLRSRREREFVVTFTEIERAIGAKLPASSALPQWWANITNPMQAGPQRAAWGEAGFDAFLISGTGRVRFVRVR